MGSFFEVMQAWELRNQRFGRPPWDRVDALLAKIQWSSWCAAAGGEEKLLRSHCEATASSGEKLVFRKDELLRYRSLEHRLSKAHLDRIANRYPPLKAVFEWPVRLLSVTPLRRARIHQMMRPYFFQHWPFDDGDLWSFPEGAESDDPNRLLVHSTDFERLYERGDAFGFLGLVASYRLAHLNRNVDSQWWAATYMVMALPGFCRAPNVREHWELVTAITQDLLQLLPDCVMPIHMDIDILRDQIFAKIHEPCRSLRERMQRSGIPVAAPENPVQLNRDRKTKDFPVMIAGRW